MPEITELYDDLLAHYTPTVTCRSCKKKHYRRHHNGDRIVAIACDCGNSIYPHGILEKQWTRDIRSVERWS